MIQKDATWVIDEMDNHRKKQVLKLPMHHSFKPFLKSAILSQVDLKSSLNIIKIVF
jgi:hypothetical protein